jgi:hypothetical protein
MASGGEWQSIAGRKGMPGKWRNFTMQVTGKMDMWKIEDRRSIGRNMTHPNGEEPDRRDGSQKRKQGGKQRSCLPSG